MNDEAVERLELKIAFLEKANNELSDVVYRQQRQIDDLLSRIASITGQLGELKQRPQEYTMEEERPPHY